MSAPIPPSDHTKQANIPPSTTPGRKSKLAALCADAQVKIENSSIKINAIHNPPNSLSTKTKLFGEKLLGTFKSNNIENLKDFFSKPEHFHIALISTDNDQTKIHLTNLNIDLLKKYKVENRNFHIINHHKNIIFVNESHPESLFTNPLYSFDKTISMDIQQKILSHPECRIIRLSEEEWSQVITILEETIELTKNEISKGEEKTDHESHTDTDKKTINKHEPPQTSVNAKKEQVTEKQTNSNKGNTFSREEMTIATERQRKKHEQALNDERAKVNRAIDIREHKEEIVKEQTSERDTKFWRDHGSPENKTNA
jgi:hypothetical protein